MLVHIVCFKYKTDVTPETRREHRKRLAGLSALEHVVQLQVGEDVVRSSRSYDTGLIVTFRDRDALDAYQQDSQHIPVAQFGVTLAEHIVAVDFEA
jgi:hypothetical protein